MKRSRALAVLAPCIFATVLSGASWAGHGVTDWPQFRLDENHTGSNTSDKTFTAKNVKFLQTVWQAKLGDAVSGFSEPTVVGKIVYVTSSDGTLWAFPADGCGKKQSDCAKPLWQSTNLSQILDTPNVANGVVYVGSQTSPESNDGLLSAFAASGCGKAVCEPLWQGQLGNWPPESSSAAVSNGMVFIATFGGKLFAFDAEGCGNTMCEPVWTADIGAHSESTPTVSKGILYVAADGSYKTQHNIRGYIYAFDAKGCGKRKCSPLWMATMAHAPFETTPAVSNGKIYVLAQDGLYAFDAHGCGAPVCTPLWKGTDTNTSDEFGFDGSPAVGDGYVYVSFEQGIDIFPVSGCGKPQCIDVGQLFGSGLQGSMATPTLANGLVFAANDQGYLHVWKAKPCGTVDCFDLISYPVVSFGGEPTSVAILNGTIYLGDEDQTQSPPGRLFVLKLVQ